MEALPKGGLIGGRRPSLRAVALPGGSDLTGGQPSLRTGCPPDWRGRATTSPGQGGGLGNTAARGAGYVSPQALKQADTNKNFRLKPPERQRMRMLRCIKRALIWSQELGDEKIQNLSQMMELVESQTRQVDSHVELLEAPQEIKDTTGNSCKASQEKAKNKTVEQAEKPNNKCTLWPLNNVNQVMSVSNNNHDHDDITSGTPKEKNAKTSKNRLQGQSTEGSKPCKPSQQCK
ncbi:Inhibitor of growth protein 1 [Sciurus carolinensis]|uniref:Inhibitor of growth protein 1 n=1 Tax=Sciurus carolinensis TaxID=30640 RepID=A0AA41N496_SCICA|nr:Inhibitor of growth protein 1 [Sciurus carolinensis]